MPKCALTKSVVDRLTPPEKSSIWWDTRVVGFGVRVSPKGRKTFIVRYRLHVDGRRLDRKQALGVYPVLSVEQARRMAVKVLGEASAGQDPVADKYAPPGLTVGNLCEQWLVASDMRESSLKSIGYTVNARILPKWAERFAVGLTRRDVQTYHDEVALDSGNTAAAVVRHVRAAYNWAVRSGVLPEDTRNPAVGVKVKAPASRARFMTRAEAPRILASIRAVSEPRTRILFVLLLCTAGRVGEIVSLAWDDWLRDEGLLQLEKTKSGQVQYKPLIAQSVAAMSLAEDIRETGPWVFPAQRSANRHAHPHGMPTKAWQILRARAGVEDLRIHDLRRTVASWLAQAGTPEYIIKGVLTHARSDVTSTYARLGVIPIRAALEEFVSELEEAAGMTLAAVLKG